MSEEPIEAVVERAFRGWGMALRREDEPPIPGEPLMSMARAKTIARELILNDRARHTLSGAWVAVPPIMRWAQVQRLRFIGHLIETAGRVNRADLTKKFGISTPQASVDIRAFIANNPGRILYDRTAKSYISGANVTQGTKA